MISSIQFGRAQTIDADTLKVFTKQVSTVDSYVKIQPIISRELTGQNLGDLLKYMSPNFIKMNGPGGISTISMKGGSASQTQIFWEGIAINSPTLGQTDLSLLPVEFFRNISIYQTGTSSQLGLGGIAGSVSIKSMGQYSYGGNVHFEKEIGGFGMNNTSGSFTMAYNSRCFSETVILKKYGLNNFTFRNYSRPNNPVTERNNSEFSQLGFQENLQIKIKSGWLKFVTNYTDTERGIPVAIGVADQDQFLTDRNFRTTLQYKTSRSVQGDGEDYREFSHIGSLGFIHDFQNYRNIQSSLNSNYYTTTYSGQFQSKYELKKGFGLNTQVNNYLYQAKSSGFSEVKFQNRLSMGINGSKRVKKFLFNISAQDILINNQISPIISNFSTSYYFNAGKIDQEIFGNLGTNFRYPTLNDLYWSISGNPNLDPERSKYLEAGIKSSYSFKRKIDYSFTYFNDLVSNWIQWIPNSTGIWTPENVKSVQKSGLEGFIQYRKPLSEDKYIIVASSYRWVNAKVKESLISQEEIGKQLIYTPNHVASIDATIKLKNIFIRYDQSITSKFYLDRDNLTYLPYSAPANFTIEYRFKEYVETNITQLNVAFSAHNIWNEEYQIVGNQPMPGRWFSIKLTYNLFNNSFGIPTH
ncbi:MAG: TonB-dependent receptor [Flavobacteriales bacterium]|nr:TonB-dependent receptor [Flavobacteriales bacterium]